MKPTSVSPNPSISAQPHKVLLTFDDGPHPLHTVAVLDMLALRGVRAVVFVLGRNLESAANRAIAARAASEGHIIGNHGYSHTPLTALSDAQIEDEILRTDQLIGDLNGGIKLWRPPFSQTDSRVDEVIRSLGYTRMLWNVDTQDWLQGQESLWAPNSVHKIRRRQAHACRNTVCLLHDTLPSTAAHLCSFLNALAELPGTRIARYAPEYPDALALADEPAPVPAICPADAVSFPLRESLVISRSGINTIYVLNQSARVLWESLSAGASPADAARTMAGHFGIPEDAATRDVDAALAVWRSRGLVGPRPPESEDLGPWPLLADEEVVSSPHHFEEEHCYRFLDSGFRIRYQSADFARAIHPRFVNLETVNSSPDTPCFDIFRAGEQCILRTTNGCATRHPSAAAVAYRLLFEILRFSSPELQPIASLHASLAACGDCAIALVGDNGSGKSTLAAALASSGFQALGDDRLLLDFPSARPVASPNALSLKRGSWDILSSQYPEIKRLPKISCGPDDVVYLPVAPPRERLLPPVTHLFFPRYSSLAVTAAAPLTVVEALERITTAGSWISSDPAKLQCFLQWAEDLRCCDLPYSDLDAAVAQIRECLRT